MKASSTRSIGNPIVCARDVHSRPAGAAFGRLYTRRLGKVRLRQRLMPNWRLSESEGEMDQTPEGHEETEFYELGLISIR